MEQISQTLNSFYQAAQDYGFSRDYQARITDLVINGNSFTVGSESQKPLLYIKNFAIPSTKKIISTVKYNGADIHSVGPRTFGDNLNWRVTFYSDQNLLIRQWLERRLIESASNEDVRINYNPVPGNDSYATIDVVNDNLESVVQYKLEGLFVVDMPGADYDLAGSGKIQEFTVTFGYQKWMSVPKGATGYDTSAAPGGGGGRGGGLLGGIIGGLNAIAGVANAVRGTANAVRGTASSIRGAGRAIRGR
jgi:hypothetical protein